MAYIGIASRTTSSCRLSDSCHNPPLQNKTKKLPGSQKTQPLPSQLSTHPPTTTQSSHFTSTSTSLPEYLHISSGPYLYLIAIHGLSSGTPTILKLLCTSSPPHVCPSDGLEYSRDSTPGNRHKDHKSLQSSTTRGSAREAGQNPAKPQSLKQPSKMVRTRFVATRLCPSSTESEGDGAARNQARGRDSDDHDVEMRDGEANMDEVGHLTRSSHLSTRRPVQN